MADPAEVSTDVLVLARNALLAILLLTLLALPIGIVNDTARENAHRFGAVLARVRRLRLPVSVAAERTPLAFGFAVVAAVSAVIYGFLAPAFGFDLSSLALALGMALAFLVVSLGKDVSRAIYLRRAFEVGTFVRLFPAFALIGIGCVLISRVIGFQPGLILGTLAALGFRGDVAVANRGRATAVGAATLAVLGALAWFLRAPLVAAVPPGFLANVLAVTLTAIAVAAAENLAFGLLPFTFLDGAPLFGWSKVVWACFAFFGAFAFVHVLLQRAAGPFLDRVGYLLVLLVIYLVAAIAFWGWFRFRREVATAARE